MQSKLKILFTTEFTKLNTGYSNYYDQLMRALHSTGKYELFELASYAQGSNPLHQQMMRDIPWKVYPVLPDNDQEAQIYNANPMNEFGKFRFEAACLDAQPHIVCFPPETPVMTDCGYKEISEIKIGDCVLTHKNRFKRVIDIHRRQYNGELIKIYANGCSQPLRLTPDHPVYIYRNKKQTNQKKSILDIYKDETPEFVPACDVKKNDYVILPTFSSYDENKIDIRNYIKNFILEGEYIKENSHPNNNYWIKYIIPVNEDLARLAGYIIGDGYIRDSGITISFQGNETRFVDDVRCICSSLFGNFIIVKANPDKNKYMINVDINSVLLSQFFGKWVGLRTKTKFIPKEIILSKDSVRANILSGLIRSDGYYGKNTISFCSINRMLAYTYRAVCSSIGIASLLSKYKNNNCTFYIVNVYGLDAIRLHSFVNKKNEIPKQPTNRLRDSSRVKLLNKNHFISKITRVRSDNSYYGQVYNLEVEDDNSYTTQWNVHNCSIKDFWMDSYLEESPFRRFYKLVIMPTLDGTPLHLEWISLYKNCDNILTYTDWSKELLERESGNTIKVDGVASPAVDVNIFKPPANRKEHKAKFGIDPNSFIVGMVARNQKRKLYPDLAKSFSEFIQKLDSETSKNVYLYFHCAYPDVGFDIPQIIKSNGLCHKVLMTYICQNCRRWFPDFYQDSVTFCKFCHQRSATLSNSQFGIERSQLADVYGLIDLYAQHILLEGFGLPHMEAAACGCITCGTDYSGTIDILKKTGGKPIPVKRFYQEAETGRNMALPDNDALIEYINEIYLLPNSMRSTLSNKTHLLTHKNLGSWEKVAQTWMNVFDKIEVPSQNPWLSPIDFIPTENIPCPGSDKMNDEQFVSWCLTEILHRPEWVNSYRGLKFLRDLYWGTSIISNLSFFANDMGMLGSKPTRDHFNREKMLQHIIGFRQYYNQSEQARHQFIQNGKIQ